MSAIALTWKLPIRWDVNSWMVQREVVIARPTASYIQLVATTAINVLPRRFLQVFNESRNRRGQHLHETKGSRRCSGGFAAERPVRVVA